MSSPLRVSYSIHSGYRATDVFRKPGIDCHEWPLPFLIDYIQLLHHAYVRNSGWALARQLHEFLQEHPQQYPHLVEVEEAYADLLELLIEQIAVEEEQLFPYLRQVCSAHANQAEYGALFVRTLARPIPLADGSHRIAPLLQRLRVLTDHYTCGPKASGTEQGLYRRLREFDEDLQEHQRLEQDVLLPRVTSLEKELRAL